ncbi:acid type B receptor subunit 2 [Seminavis robusta]|uniref:Acid type B receptor subunit 2 n=1 Tax=Seminavis robusta TaxID=568900 RepID=A0A9N8EKK6_9STRA|nr:acid type B receptor subunit 2 [Seminavis robusta]|eukprot:Sro1081_g239120.1 acid type B receptor subunit 2 (1022) ;mRNA; r:26753-30130
MRAIRSLAAVAGFVLGVVAQDSSDPLYYDNLRDTNSGLLNDVSVSEDSNVFQVHLGDGTQYRLAELKAFLPLSNGASIRAGYQDDAAAALLAVYHFNNLDMSPIITEEDVEGCDVKLTMEIVDSKFSPIGSTRVFTESLHTENTLSTPLPTAVIGAYRSATTSPLAILTGVNGIPQASYASSSTDFDVKEQFPLFGRTVTSSTGEAKVALDYFQSIKASHVGVLFVTDAYGSALQKAFQDAANDAGMVTDSVAFSFSADLNGDEIENAIDHLKHTEFRLFYVICFENHLRPIVKTALEHGIIGPDYLWIFPGFERTAVEPLISGDTMMAKATLGMGLLNVEGGVRKEPIIPKLGLVAPLEDVPETGYEKFRTAWRKARAHSTFVEFLQAKLPNSLETIEGFDREAPFSNEPGSFRPMLYDAVMGMALAMCRAGDSTEFFTGTNIYDEFLQLNFTGASGSVRISNETGTREFQSLTYALWNIQPYEDADEHGNPQVKLVPSARYDNGVWKSIVGNPYIFADGSLNPPESLPPVDEKMNYIGDAGRIAAFVLMALVMLASVLSLVWMGLFWQERVVSSSQPLFLVLVSVGSFVMVSAIIPLSYDETVTEEIESLNSACMAGPWLYIIGAVIAFSALFAKTRGIHKAYANPELDFIHVTSFDIFGTLAFLLAINMIILTCWTVLNPREWTRTQKDATDVFDRAVESYGSCTGDDSLPYVIILLVVNFLFLIVGNWWAYQSRNIETEYLESRYIGISMAAVLQAWCMGIPILIVVWDTPQAKFFVETGIIFVTSLAFLLLIYVPKVMASIADRKNAIAEEKRKAYSSFIENRVKRENSYADTGAKGGADSDSDNSSVSSIHEGETTDETSNEIRSSAESSSPVRTSLTSRAGLMGLAKQASNRSARLGFSGAQKLDEKTDPTTGIKIIHNPRSERNLNVTQGREMSRRQLAQYCGSDSESEDDRPAKLEKISSSQDQDVSEPIPPPVPVVLPVEEQSPEVPAEEHSPQQEQSPEPEPEKQVEPTA